MINLTPEQAKTVEDISRRLKLTVPANNMLMNNWLNNACPLFIGLLISKRQRVASRDTIDLVTECLQHAFFRMPGYDRLQELMRAEEYCQAHLDKIKEGGGMVDA